MSTTRTSKIRNKYYVYGLVDPRTSKIRYVGYSYDPNARLRFHLRDTCTSHKVHWLKSILSIGLSPEVVILAECVDEKRAKQEEIAWIQRIGRNNLTNSTAGGEGVVGLVHNPQSRAKMSASHQGMDNHQLGRKQSKEAREKIGKAAKGRAPWNKGGGHPMSEEGKLARKGVLAGDKHPMFGKTHSEEARKKISNSKKGKPAWNKGLKTKRSDQ